MRIACRTAAGDGDGNYAFAWLDIDAAKAKELLRLGDMAVTCRRKVESFYGIEIYDYSVSYGDIGDLPESVLEQSDVWENMTGLIDVVYSEPARTAADTLIAVLDGVLWTAQPNEQGDSFTMYETATLSWGDIQMLAAGMNPFEEKKAKKS